MDETKLTEFVEKAVGDVGALLGGAMVVIGDRLGLYRAMAGAGPLTPGDWPAAPAQPSDTYGSGPAPRRPAATSPTTAPDDSRCPTNTPSRSPMKPARPA
jgi:hypothetical protein